MNVHFYYYFFIKIIDYIPFSTVSEFNGTRTIPYTCNVVLKQLGIHSDHQIEYRIFDNNIYLYQIFMPNTCVQGTRYKLLLHINMSNVSSAY